MEIFKTYLKSTHIYKYWLYDSKTESKRTLFNLLFKSFEYSHNSTKWVFFYLNCGTAVPRHSLDGVKIVNLPCNTIRGAAAFIGRICLWRYSQRDCFCDSRQNWFLLLHANRAACVRLQWVGWPCCLLYFVFTSVLSCKRYTSYKTMKCIATTDNVTSWSLCLDNEKGFLPWQT